MNMQTHNMISSEYLFAKITPDSDDYFKALQINADGVDERYCDDVKKTDLWIKNPNKSTQCIPYGFYKNGNVIGFILFTVFSKEGFIYGDYLSISPKERRIRAVITFIYLIRAEIDKLYNMPLFFEIATDNPNNTVAARAYKSAGVGLLECKHFIPGSNLSNEMIPARMLIYPHRKTIDKNTYSTYLRALFLDDYIASAASFLEEEEKKAYTRYVLDIYENLKDEIPDIIHIT